MKNAEAFQKFLKALASFILTNDEIVGTAIEDVVVQASYPNANWIVKGENNKVNGWLKLEMH